MLILTRKEGESLYIGDSIIVTVQSVRGDSVRIAIDAPKEIPILRKELKETKQINKEALLPEVSAINALMDNLKKIEK